MTLTIDDYAENVRFPITIGRKPMPILTRYEENTLQARTTIVLKTFIRYACLTGRGDTFPYNEQFSGGLNLVRKR